MKNYSPRNDTNFTTMFHKLKCHELKVNLVIDSSFRFVKSKSTCKAYVVGFVASLALLKVCKILGVKFI